MAKIYSKMKTKLKRMLDRINNDDPRDDYPHPPSEDPDSSETPTDPIDEELKRLREEARQNRVRVYAGY